MREGLQKVVPTDDTIVAISTPVGRSGIGVVRLSGNDVEQIAAKFLATPTALVHRQATVGSWVDVDGTAVDEVVVVLFKSPNSYTGDDVLEISAHGNPLILARIVEATCRAGARLAGPGEFTLRAVVNGKLDLLQAEAVRNFIDAQTDAQARVALLQMGGALSNRVLPVKEKLVDVIAHLEAGIDFADDDVQPPDGAAIVQRMEELRQDLAALQKTYAYGKLLATGLRLAIVGKPNVGKSSLFNRFVGADRAIVTDIPGTTRDVLTESVSLDGIPLRFSDTAGLRETVDTVEKIGSERSVEALHESDLVLVVLDGTAPLDDWDRNILSRVEGAKHILVINKSDLKQAHDILSGHPVAGVRVSAMTGEGMDVLRDSIRDFLRNYGEGLSDSILTSARQDESVAAAIRALDKGSEALRADTPHEMVLLDIYEVLAALNELTGEVVTDDILGRIFSTFCVGK